MPLKEVKNIMKICVVQTRPDKGDIQSNIDDHKKFIELAAAHGADIVIFPELSLTGYEPTLAQELATYPDDYRLDEFQKTADSRQITIGVGLPTRQDRGICISLLIFQPNQARQLYSKQYLHADEEPFFVSGPNSPGLLVDNKIALAICYELSIAEHAERAYQNGAEIYIASVAKSVQGVEQASRRLAEIAQKYAMTVLMSNCLGPSDNFDSAGQTAVWNHQGRLLEQLNNTHEGLIIYDSDSLEVIKKEFAEKGNTEALRR
jgi:predicted amidohydrolase